MSRPDIVKCVWCDNDQYDGLAYCIPCIRKRNPKLFEDKKK